MGQGSGTNIVTTGTKRCPYCGEEINVTATKCRYCGEWLANQVIDGCLELISFHIGKPIELILIIVIR